MRDPVSIAVAALVLSCGARVVAQTEDAAAEKQLTALLEKAAPAKDAPEAKRKETAEELRAGLAKYVETWAPKAAGLGTGRHALARAYLLLGRPADAIPHLVDFTARFPKSADAEDALLGLGAAYLDVGEFDKAQALYEDFLAKRPESDQRIAARFYLGVAHLEAGRVARGLAELEAVAAAPGTSPFVADAQVKIVQTLVETGRAPEARARLEALLKDKPDAPALLDQKERADRIGKPAPEIEGVRTWIGGEPRTLAGSRGRVVVLTFFADFYASSQSELDMIEGLRARYAGKPVDFVGITTYYRKKDKTPDEEDAGLRAFLDARGAHFPVGVVSDFRVLKAYGVKGVPYTVVVDRDGAVAHIKPGGSRRERRSAALLAEAIDRALR